MDKCREVFFHTYGRTAASYIPGCGQEFFYVQHGGTFVPRDFGSRFQIHLFVTGNDTYKNTGFITSQHQCLEYLFYIFAQFGRNMVGRQIVFVYRIGYLLKLQSHFNE